MTEVSVCDAMPSHSGSEAFVIYDRHAIRVSGSGSRPMLFAHGFEEMLELLSGNFLGWSSAVAPAIMGNPDRPELGADLTQGFCRTDPIIAAHFARVSFFSDTRADLPQICSPTLVLQYSQDVIAPDQIGRYVAKCGLLRFSDMLSIAGRIYFETKLSTMLRLEHGFWEVALTLAGPGRAGRNVLVTATAEAGAIDFVVFEAEQRRVYERELAALLRFTRPTVPGFY